MWIKIEKDGKTIRYPDKRTFYQQESKNCGLCNGALENYKTLVINYLRHRTNDKVWLGNTCYYCNGNDILRRLGESYASEIIGHVQREGDLLCYTRQNR